MKPSARPLFHHFFKQSSPFRFNILKPVSANPHLHNSETKNSTIKSITNTPFCDGINRGFQFSQSRILFSAVTSSKSQGNCPIDAANSSFQNSITPNLLLFIKHSPMKKAFWEATSVSAVNVETPPSGLIIKTPSSSRTSVVYKFSSDNALAERYRNSRNEIRIDNLLEDLDALAATISYKHCSSNDGTDKSLRLVTACVEKMILKKPIHTHTDISVEGAVIWVGSSSVEIQLEVKQCAPAEACDESSLTANFTFVGRDSKTGKSARINPISPQTEKEKLLWQEAEERNKMRKKKREEEKDISRDEVNWLNQLFVEGGNSCDSIFIKDTCLENSLVCQPEHRNIHGNIFGGFLMRKAFESAYATAYEFAGSKPCFVELDRVDFLKPVEVGDLLNLKSCVLFTETGNSSRPLINVEVVAHVTHPQHLSSEVSNNFYFTFTVHSDSLRNGLKIKNVIPGTEEEAHRVIKHIDFLRNWSNEERRLEICM